MNDQDQKRHLNDPPSRMRAFIYARTDTHHPTTSIDAQCEAVRAYADAHDMDVVRVYADAGKSGSSLERRDHLKRLFSDVASADRDFDVILLHDWTRWGRFQDLDESAGCYEYNCARGGIELRSYTQSQTDSLWTRDTDMPFLQSRLSAQTSTT